MRLLNILLAIVVVALALWFAHTRDVKARQESAHRAAVESLRKQFPYGTSRAEVEQYLESHGMKYSSTLESSRNAWSDVVQVDKETSAAAGCGNKSLLVSIEYDPGGQSPTEKPQPTDRLKRIFVTQGGGC